MYVLMRTYYFGSEIVGITIYSKYADAFKEFESLKSNKSIKWIELRCCHSSDDRSCLMDYHTNVDA